MTRPIYAILFSWAIILLAVVLPRVTEIPPEFAIGIWVAGLALQGLITAMHFIDTGTGTGTGTHTDEGGVAA